MIHLTRDRLVEAERLLRELRHARCSREAAGRSGDPERARASRRRELVIERRLARLLPSE